MTPTTTINGVPRYLITKNGEKYLAMEEQLSRLQGEGWTLSSPTSTPVQTQNTQLVYRMGSDGTVQKEAITPEVLQLNLDVGWVTSEAEAKQQTPQAEWTPGVTLSPEAAKKLDSDFQAFSNLSDTVKGGIDNPGGMGFWTQLPDGSWAGGDSFTGRTMPAGWKPGDPDPKYSAVESQRPATSGSLLPDNILTSPDYQSLGSDLQGVLELMYGAMSANTAQNQNLAFEAISAAQEYVDPYIGVMIAFQKDELMDRFAYEQRSLSARQASYGANLAAISKLKQNATLEEKQVLASIGREYEQKKNQVSNDMADRGLTYSSTRSDLESYIGYQNRDLIQSTRRNTQNTLANLDARASEAASSLSSAQAAADYNRQNAARQAEQQFGTAMYNQMGLGVESIGGHNGVPEYAGQIQMDRQNMILDLATRIQDYGTPAALSGLFNTNT